MDGRKIVGPVVLLGIGLGGFVDGILLHQILDWHHLLSARTGDIRLNMLADGLFHLLCLILVIAGVALLVRAAPQAPPDRGRRAFGWMLAGWGWFNLVEGIIDHQILGIHHVVEYADNKLPYDLAFLASGVILMLIGGALIRAGGKDTLPRGEVR